MLKQSIYPFIYPTCEYTLQTCLRLNPKLNDLYKTMNFIKLFDVSLRDGLQALPKEQQPFITLEIKKNMYKDILQKYNPYAIEVGSIVSPKVLPIMSNSLEFLHWANEETKELPCKNVLLIPNEDKLTEELKKSCKNFSLITSVSNSFQEKNIKKTLLQTKQEISTILYEKLNITKNPSLEPFFKKLYISCINECPITGKINNNFIIKQILDYHFNYFNNIDIICLSDTCGTLQPHDFEYIIDNCLQIGLPVSNLGIHLHTNEQNKHNTIEILHKAFDKKIAYYDVSVLQTGGCSVTMTSEKLASNLSYDLFYEALIRYMVKQI